MSLTSRLAGALFATSALVSPSVAFAQTEPAPSTDQPPTGDTAGQPADDSSAQPVDISVPGGEIVVTGVRNRNLVKTSDQVISVLSTEEIARTGEGNIAGALGRVTGLSVVGNGLVYVRGLGDRYSLALLNGSPLPSPEPLRRVVPLDIFPSGVIASSLVQKSYSVNYPGEFGGGVINLTTKAVPREPFLSISFGGTADSETTGRTGYSYFGSKSDWTGFDDGSRDFGPALTDYFKSGALVNSDVDLGREIGSELVRFSKGTAQRVRDLPPAYSISLSGGTGFDLGGARLGIIAAAGFSNKWRNRDARQQTSLSADLSTLQTNFNRISTDDRIVANGLLGFGLEFGENKIRWTNLYIRDTIKQTRLGLGQRNETSADFMQQDTAWYERQLIDSQLVGEFKPAPGMQVDVRVGYAKSQREAPYETSFEYVRTNSSADPYGRLFVNRLNGNNGEASVTFSDLNEELWSGGIDLTYVVSPVISATVGGYFSDTDRISSRRQFLFRASSTFPVEASVLRPDLLLSPGLINGTVDSSTGQLVGGIDLIEPDTSSPAFEGKLRNYAGYGKVNFQITDALSLDAGVRFEKARQSVSAVQVFSTPPTFNNPPALRKEYWLPGATLTYQVQPDLQVRLSASKTIARPQFRELIYQPYFDPENNRQYLGNPLLTDSQLYNGEARVEWYFAPEQRLSISGFYKKIDKPIEAFVVSLNDSLVTSYANAPEARLYGAEIELQKYFDLSEMGGWFSQRRAVAIVNYTYSKSELKVQSGDTVAVYAASSGIATDYFRDGAPLTGQSDHLVNLQFGFENTERLSQQTILLSYASERAMSRGLNGSVPQPDVIERPGWQLDFVAREGVQFLGQEFELKFEARNLLYTRHREYQQVGSNTLEFNTYDLGTTVSASASIKF
ncbi:TonB-dependent receptor domain-containing protein [Novosphingobium album (ex Liu et al. 2023)]|uniref:TonB-dependent receptor n=1 Tax=Novosphingobium album (ex Liu et al. 2023) TaxID=3031130 RepID=A0ABT5WJD1_9SPHN|nr:TonB-dependent receptor [Novosphingobium album (ex Liu et al. 2023)]MDE8650150.1 TonB-dependent receptor [Novosphingobium album (ex Liu et al. 2023)]